MWLIFPLIFVLSWRMTRRIGQALNETVAWTIGYFGTAGLLWLTDFGGLDLIEARPNSPGALIALGGGFAGMVISRWQWKRRGGHLEPRRNWVQEVARWAGRASAKRVSSQQGSGQRSVPGSAGEDLATVTGKMLGRIAANLLVPELRRRNRWVRALRALGSHPEQSGKER